MAEKRRRMRPAHTPQEREMQLGSLAYDLAEEQMLAGTASASVIVHFLKASSVREKKELAKLENDNLLAKARIEQTSQESTQKVLLEQAMAAFTTYQGGAEDDDES